VVNCLELLDAFLLRSRITHMRARIICGIIIVALNLLTTMIAPTQSAGEDTHDHWWTDRFAMVGDFYGLGRLRFIQAY
jgi:hypothetical protein